MTSREGWIVIGLALIALAIMGWNLGVYMQTGSARAMILLCAAALVAAYCSLKVLQQ